MKLHTTHSYMLPLLMGALGFSLAGAATAQTFATLHHFTDRDGANPYGGVTLSSNTLYGATYAFGAIFSMQTDGMGFKTLYRLAPTEDGSEPMGGLVISDGVLYGTATSGGNSNSGTVFKINTDGSRFTVLHSFTAVDYANPTNSDGYYPMGRLVVSNNTLYGTTQEGGPLGRGTVFSLKTDGTGFTNLHYFAYTEDGAYPIAGLILSDNTLYGTTWEGTSGATVFALKTDGTAFRVFHRFSGEEGNLVSAELVLSGNTLYGTAAAGGNSGNGTLFKVNTDGTEFKALYHFSISDTNSFGVFTNRDGAFPMAGLTLAGSTLYGTANRGGSAGNGTVFRANTDGSGFETLYSFSATGSQSWGVLTNLDGALPTASLVLSGTTMYGAAAQVIEGFPQGFGTVFSLSLPPSLTVSRSSRDVVLTWPIEYGGLDYGGYSLQSATNLGASATWTIRGRVTDSGQRVATIPISGDRQFFQLSHK